MSIHALEVQRGRVVQGQADQEGFLEEKRIRLHWQTIRMFCFSSLTQCFFPTSLPQSLGQSLLGLSNPVIPSGFPGLWELGQTACTRPCPGEPGLCLVACLISDAEPKGQTRTLRDEGSLLPVRDRISFFQSKFFKTSTLSFAEKINTQTEVRHVT